MTTDRVKQVKEANDIVDVVGGYVALRPAGAGPTYKGLCPFHDDSRPSFQVDPRYQPLMRQLGLDAEAVFSHPDIQVWRSIPERENCRLDARLDGREIRFHIKRYRATRKSFTPADEEARGIQALLAEEIPTVPLVGWGKLVDGRSFVITEDLSGIGGQTEEHAVAG